MCQWCLSSEPTCVMRCADAFRITNAFLEDTDKFLLNGCLKHYAVRSLTWHIDHHYRAFLGGRFPCSIECDERSGSLHVHMSAHSKFVTRLRTSSSRFSRCVMCLHFMSQQLIASVRLEPPLAPARTTTWTAVAAPRATLRNCGRVQRLHPRPEIGRVRAQLAA